MLAATSSDTKGCCRTMLPDAPVLEALPANVGDFRNRRETRLLPGSAKLEGSLVMLA